MAEGKVRLSATANTNARPVEVSAGQYAVVADATELAALPQTGGITREWWTNLNVANVNDLPDYPLITTQSNGRDLAKELELLPVRTNGLLMRFRGYLHPPTSGN